MAEMFSEPPENVSCSQVGECMAEMVFLGMLPSLSVLGVMQAATPTRPDAQARRCSWACFATFFNRLGLLELPLSRMELLPVVKDLLPRVLPEVRVHLDKGKQLPPT